MSFVSDLVALKETGVITQEEARNALREHPETRAWFGRDAAPKQVEGAAATANKPSAPCSHGCLQAVADGIRCDYCGKVFPVKLC